MGEKSHIVTLIDETGTIKYENPAVEHLGYDQNELVGEIAFDYIHPDDCPHVMETFYRAVEDPDITPTVTYRSRHADGSWRYLETTGENHLTTNPVEGLVLNSRDVTIRVGELDEVAGDGGIRKTVPSGSVTETTSGHGFFVEDDGPGSPKSTRATVFESGYTTDEGGTGLGLTIVRQIAEAHGWRVSLRESERGGARFEFEGVELAPE